MTTITIDDVITGLNSPPYMALFASPNPGVIQSVHNNPFGELKEGTKKLIMIADTFHDFSHVKNKTGIPSTTPGINTLKNWAIYIISELNHPNGFPLQWIDKIYTNAEDFVIKYLYHNDKIIYTSMQHVDVVNPINSAATYGGAVPHPYRFILLSFPKNGTDKKNLTKIDEYSKISSKILYNIFTKLKKESEWTVSGHIPTTRDEPLGWPREINGLDSIWYSQDQMAPDDIFKSYDMVRVSDESRTNWWKWVGYAAQYDRAELIESLTAKQIFKKNNWQDQTNAPPLIAAGENWPELLFGLENNECVLGIKRLVLTEDNFVWYDRSSGEVSNTVNYDTRYRTELKTYLGIALGHVSACNNLTSFFQIVFRKVEYFAKMVNAHLIPGIAKLKTNNTFAGINFDALHAKFQGPRRDNNNIISLFTDFKRIGDYLQARELYILQHLKNMRIPLITHDSILASISHKIFNNHTLLYKPKTKKRSATYVLMLPYPVNDGGNMVSGTETGHRIHKHRFGRESVDKYDNDVPGNIIDFLNVLEGDNNPLENTIWGGVILKNKRNGITRINESGITRIQRKKGLKDFNPKHTSHQSITIKSTDDKNYHNINDKFNEEVVKKYLELRARLTHQYLLQELNSTIRRMDDYNILTTDEIDELCQYVFAYLSYLLYERGYMLYPNDENFFNTKNNELIHMLIEDIYIDDLLEKEDNKEKEDINGKTTQKKFQGILGGSGTKNYNKYLYYIEKITKIKELNKELKKNKAKNINKIQKNNKLIDELKIKIKKQKEKEKEKLKKEKLKEKEKQKKEKLKEEKLKEKEKQKKEKLKTNNNSKNHK